MSGESDMARKFHLKITAVDKDEVTIRDAAKFPHLSVRDEDRDVHLEDTDMGDNSSVSRSQRDLEMMDTLNLKSYQRHDMKTMDNEAASVKVLSNLILPIPEHDAHRNFFCPREHCSCSLAKYRCLNSI